MRIRRFECRAVLLDLDGVLVDSTLYVEEQWRRWALSKGLAAEPFLEVCHGRRALETIRLAAPHLDAAAEVAAIRSEGFPGASSISPLPGASRLLQSLPSDSWAVATSGSRAEATARFKQTGLPLPRVLICAEDVLHGKPSPEVYLMAARSLGVEPTTCVVIEDAPAGVQAARAAGMGVIAVTTTHHRNLLEADAWVTSLAGIQVGPVDRAIGTRSLQLLVPQDANGLDVAGEARLK